MKIIGRSDSNPKEIVVAENVNYHYGLIICDALNGKMGVVCFNETYYPVMVGNGYELQGYDNHTVNKSMPKKENSIDCVEQRIPRDDFWKCAHREKSCGDDFGEDNCGDKCLYECSRWNKCESCVNEDTETCDRCYRSWKFIEGYTR